MTSECWKVNGSGDSAVVNPWVITHGYVLSLLRSSIFVFLLTVGYHPRLCYFTANAVLCDCLAIIMNTAVVCHRYAVLYGLFAIIMNYELLIENNLWFL
jgi:hypothetical protein